MNKIQMKLSDDTIDKINDLVVYTKIKNKTQIVADAIKVYHELQKLKVIDKGEIYIEYPIGDIRTHFIITNPN